MPLNNLQHQDSGIRDNYIRGSMADFLNQIIQQDSALSIVSAYFTIYAYDKLKDKLKDIDHLRFLFGEPRFIGSLDPDKTDKKAYKIEPEGTWRPPANEEEQELKAALRSSGALRRIKRFANALLDGVPSAECDKPENAVTLADWIRQCRRAGLFELGQVLYEKGGPRFEDLNEEMRLPVEEDYQICVGRSGKDKTKPNGIRRTDSSLFNHNHHFLLQERL